MFAGPNGSGKTTLALNIIGDDFFKTNVFVNADILEKSIKENGSFDFGVYNLKVDLGALKDYLLNNNGASVIQGKISVEAVVKKLQVLDNKLLFSGDFNSYIASDICAFCRLRLLEEGKSFIMETVFSHESKLEFMRYAKGLGYRVYFYFVCTEDPVLNVLRVQNRVLEGGHNVPEGKVINRYHRALGFLYEAIKISYRSYVWDNTCESATLFAESKEGTCNVMDLQRTPNWFINYVVNKSNLSD